MIDAHLYKFLTKAPEIRALVGRRVYPMRLPQGEVRDSIVYEIGDDYPDIWMGSLSSIVRHYVTLNTYSSTNDGMRKLSGLLKKTFQRYSGDLGGITVVSSGIQLSINEYEADEKLYRNILSIHIKTH